MTTFRLTGSFSRAALAAFITMLALIAAGDARAAELQVLAGGGITAAMKELAAQFETATGHKLIIRFGTTPELIKMATGGPFDLGVVPREVFKDSAAQAEFAGSPADIARTGLGVAVREGAPKPDVSTPAALKETLLKAKSVAAVPASAAGAKMLEAFDRLGIGEEMKAKTQPLAGPAKVVEAVAQGDAELGIFLINALTVPGLVVAGPFPGNLQQEVVFAAAVSAKPANAEAARAFIAFLSTPAAIAVLKAKGMTPG